MKKFKKMMSILLIIAVLSASACVLIAQADYTYGTKYHYQFSTAGYENTTKHPYAERDVGYIMHNLAPQNPVLNYEVRLYIRTWGEYSQFGPYVTGNTAQNGYGYTWENANPDRYFNNYAYFKVQKTSSGSSTIAGDIETYSRTLV